MTTTRTHDTGSTSITTDGPGGVSIDLLILRHGYTAVVSGVGGQGVSGAYANVRHDYDAANGVAPAALVSGF